MSGNQGIQLVSCEGQGRSFVLVFDEPAYEHIVVSLADVLKQKSKVLVYRSQSVDGSNWNNLSQALRASLAEQSVRQASLVAMGSASALIQNIGLEDVKLVRSLVIIDGTCRPHPNWKDRLIDRIESSLPLGLPFRGSTEGFDSKPYLQRLRCPILLVLTSLATEFVRDQAVGMAGRLPTSWLVDLAANSEPNKLGELVENFQDVPVKCPQKRVA
jgi:hypothetical protein